MTDRGIDRIAPDQYSEKNNDQRNQSPRISFDAYPTELFNTENAKHNRDHELERSDDHRSNSAAIMFRLPSTATASLSM